MPDSLEKVLPRQRSCSAVARRLLEEHFSSALDPRSMDDLRLVASELVDNAYLHGTGEIRIRLERHPHCVQLEVMDQGEGARVEISSAGLPSGGNGLRLVDHLCPAWGSFEGSTHVWAQVPVRPRAA